MGRCWKGARTVREFVSRCWLLLTVVGCGAGTILALVFAGLSIRTSDLHALAQRAELRAQGARTAVVLCREQNTNRWAIRISLATQRTVYIDRLRLDPPPPRFRRRLEAAIRDLDLAYAALAPKKCGRLPLVKGEE